MSISRSIGLSIFILVLASAFICFQGTALSKDISDEINNGPLSRSVKPAKDTTDVEPKEEAEPEKERKIKGVIRHKKMTARIFEENTALSPADTE